MTPHSRLLPTLPQLEAFNLTEYQGSLSNVSPTRTEPFFHIMFPLRAILHRSSAQLSTRRNYSSINAEIDSLVTMMHEVGELNEEKGTRRSTFGESNSTSLATWFHTCSPLLKADLMVHTRNGYTASFGTGWIFISPK